MATTATRPASPASHLQTYLALRTLWKTNPVLYVRQRFGIEATPQQQLILEAIAPFGAKVSVRSGHGIGKSSTAAWVVSWLLETHDYAKVPCTAPSSHQLRDILWGELSKWRRIADELSESRGDHRRFWISSLFRLINDSLVDPSAHEWGAFARTARKENPEALQGFHADHLLFVIDEGCFDDQTEILTDRGWRFFPQLDGTEQVLTRDPETGLASYARPTTYIRRQYHGPMYSFAHRTIDFCVTPNHRLWYRFKHRAKPGQGSWSMKCQEIQAIASAEFYLPRDVTRKALDVASFTLPAVCDRYGKELPPLTLDMDIWAAFLGWYFAEGSLGFRHGKAYTVVLSQRKALGRTILAALLPRLPFSVKAYPDGFHIHSWRLARLVETYGVGLVGRRIPRYMMHVSSRQMRIFLDAYREGDGYARPNGRYIYYTSSPTLANDLQEMILLSGGYAPCHPRALKGHVTWIKDHEAISSCDGYVVSESTGRSFAKVTRTKIRHTAYDGTVYCVTVPPHHLVYVRRNGMCHWSGNSGVPEEVFEAAEGALSTPGARVLMLGNPTRNAGTFADSHRHNRGEYTALHFRSQDSPLVDPDYRDRLIRKWGEHSNVVRVRADGEFPRQEDDILISLELTEPCLTREPRLGEGRRRLGVDVARMGSDRTALVLRQGSVIEHIQVYARQETMETVGCIVAVLEAWRVDEIDVDVVGLGAGVYDRLAELKRQGRFRCHVEAVNVATRAPLVEHPADAQPRLLRDHLWLAAARWLREEQPVFCAADRHANEDLAGELASVGYGFDSQGHLVVEDKDHMRKRLGHSPDLGDALCCTFSPMQVPEVDLLRGLGGRRAPLETRAQAATDVVQRWRIPSGKDEDF
jgi:hypothetical protein